MFFFFGIIILGIFDYSKYPRKIFCGKTEFFMRLLNEGIIYSISAEGWQLYLIYGLFLLMGIAAAYLLGSVNSAIIISRVLYRDDIRRHGSGNAGMTNMLRTYGKGAAGLTLLGDMLKTAIAILIMALFFGFHYDAGISIEGNCYIAGLFAILGHVFPVYYGFKGGKGVLCTATMALVLTPFVFVLLLALFIAIVAVSKYVSLGSVSVAVLYPIAVTGYVKLRFGMPTPGLITLCAILIAIFIVWCHRHNLQRISDRTENKISFKKKPTVQKADNTNGEDISGASTVNTDSEENEDNE